MTSTRGLDPFPTNWIDSLPPDVRQAYVVWHKASRVVRLYRRRGWNDSAVCFANERAKARYHLLLREHEARIANPTLFD